MINLQIDIDNLAADYELSIQDQESLIRHAVNDVATGYEDQWRIESRNLFSSRKAYSQSIRSNWVGKFTKAVYLDPSSWIANAVENGVSSFDMKAGMLASPKAKITAKGTKYMTIPFKFATSGSIGDGEQFSGVMPSYIQRAIRRQERLPSGNKKGLPLSSIKAADRMPVSASLRQRFKDQGVSGYGGDKATSIYEGLKRNTKKGHSGYVMFRRISENSDPLRFIHSGIQRRGLSELAMNTFKPEIYEIIGDSVDDFLGIE